MVKNKPFF